MSVSQTLSIRKSRKIPVVLQGERNECGLACVAMVSAFWNRKVDIAVLRDQIGNAPRGLTLRMLINVCSAFGFNTRPVQIGLHRLSDLQLPAILHWNMDHFVVLEKVGRRSVIILDPAKGRLRVDLGEVGQKFTGVALELTPSVNFEIGRLRLSRSFRQAWLKDRGLRTALIKTVILTLASQLLLITLPFIYRNLIESADLYSALDYAVPMAIGVGLLILSQFLVSWLRGVVVTRLGTLFVQRISVSLMTHIFKLPIKFFQNQLAGDLMARIRSIHAIRQFLTDHAIGIVFDVFIGLIGLAALVLFDWRFGLVVAAGVFANLGLRLASFPREKSLSIQVIQEEGVETSRLLETLHNIQAIKLGGREPERLALWNNDLYRAMNAQAKLMKRRAFIDALAASLATIELVIMLFVGVVFVSGSGNNLVGIVFGALAYRGIVQARLAGVVSSLWAMQDFGIHLRRLDDLMLASVEVEEGLPRLSAPANQAVGIELRNVVFTYSKLDPPVLKGVNMDIPAGSNVAIVGASGAGKSTLVKTILGLELPTQGQIFVGGEDITEIDRRSWRERIGIVMQNDTLLAGSICDNISFFEPQMDMIKVQDAARAADIHEDIMAMPMGYHTLIGDMGVQISGGQRQRILIARALFRDPSILIFDEGTANVDTDSEHQIAKTLAGLDLTRIIIAHRSALVEYADRVYVMKNGLLEDAPPLSDILERAKEEV